MNLIGFQDQLAPDADLAAAWKNEAYRLNVQKQILHEESVSTGRVLIHALDSQRQKVSNEILREVQKNIDAHLEQVKGRLTKMEAQVRYTERRLLRWSSLHTQPSANSVSDMPSLIRTNALLVDENVVLERENRELTLLVQKLKLENSALIKEQSEFGAIASGKEAVTQQLPVTNNARSVIEKADITGLLQELKILEVEAKRLLIK